MCFGVSLGGAFVVQRLWQQVPDVQHLADYDPKIPLRIYARDGTLLAEYGEERREFVPIERIPQTVQRALLAIEDARYYEHGAVDFVGLFRALGRNIAVGERAQGGSTITMQVARVFFLTHEKSYTRKIIEVLLAYKLESAYSKDKILELYMNQIYLGERAYGFAAAASVYFDKTLDQLSVAEAAMLASLPKAPSAYNPVVNPQRAISRQQHILNRMLDLGYLDVQTHEQARAEPLTLRSKNNSVDPAAAYAVEQVRKIVVERFGSEAYSRGLDVTTTISLREQHAATRALRTGLLNAQNLRGYEGPEGRTKQRVRTDDKAGIHLALVPFRDSGFLRAAVVLEVGAEGLTAALRDGTILKIPHTKLDPGARAMFKPGAPPRKRIAPGSVIRVIATSHGSWSLAQLPQMEGALVSIDAQSGDVLALAGGFDFTFNKFDHAVQAIRQPGSTFKPFVFSAALEKGYFPGTMIDDTQRLVTPRARGRKAWSPRNYGDNYEGFITARRGLTRSKNVVAVNLMEAAGVEYVQQFATRFGFVDELNPPGLPLALGAGAITPLQLTQAYAVFANGGERVETRLILKVSERDRGVLFEVNSVSPKFRVISQRNAYVMDSMLRDVVLHGTARRAATLGRRDVAGKTGTSNDARDVWFSGYSSGVASVVWMGYDQPKSLGRHTGGTLALPVWADYMKAAIVGRAEFDRTPPADLIQLDGDFVYKEYLEGSCVAGGHTFIQSQFECGSGNERHIPNPSASGQPSLSERDKIIQLSEEGLN